VQGASAQSFKKDALVLNARIYVRMRCIYSTGSDNTVSVSSASDPNFEMFNNCSQLSFIDAYHSVCELNVQFFGVLGITSNHQ
jgi:hypothetical protein